MGFVSLVFLMCLSILMYGHGDEKTADSDSVMVKAFGMLKPYEESIGYYGIFFGLLAIVSSILFMPPYYWGYSGFFVIRPLANGLLVVLALPFGYRKFMAHFKAIKPDTQKTVDAKVAAILRNHRTFAIIGFVTFGLMFLSMNRFY